MKPGATLGLSHGFLLGYLGKKSLIFLLYIYTLDLSGYVLM
jgi:hypothetical protein